jgi:xanthine dehydrogenase YagS FAD-binding subunit
VSFFALSNLTAKSQIGIDEPASFELLHPRTPQEAFRMMVDANGQAVMLAGGCDILEKIKTQWIRPKFVVNLKSIPGFNTIEGDSGARSIGALTTLSQVAKSSMLPQALREAAGRVASPQIRNVGTIGGNILQDSRCPYYRGPWNCYRAGGLTCDAVRGYTYEHALFGGERCYTVSPSDTAPALLALNAEIEFFGGGSGELKRIPIDQLFALPSFDITRMVTLFPDLMVTRIILPESAKTVHSTFRKAALRNAWDFALTSVAVAAQMDGERCNDIRIVLGAVAPIPWRATEAENILRGVPLKGARLEDAVQASVHGAQPLTHNHYKIGLVKNLVRECLEEIASGSTSNVSANGAKNG